MTSAAVSVRGVGKAYRIYSKPQDRLKQMLVSRFGREYGHDFWALRHCSFELQPGERFGIIGRNGSGKSTLLEIIAGTLAPTEGEVETTGRVSALLELGSGFNPEFTGRENVFINAAIQGLSREQIENRFDEIAAFADIGEFIDQPVKLYSSGMFVRLAFAVSTSIDADVLLIDEALAVGDVFFRQKCYRRLEALRERNVAVVLVSHGMGDIEQFCDRAMLLNHGNAEFIGPSVEAVKRYYLVRDSDRFGTGAQSLRADEPAVSAVVSTSPSPGPAHDLSWPGDAVVTPLPDAAQVSDGRVRCAAVGLSDLEGRPWRVFEQGQRAVFWLEFEALSDIGVANVGLVIRSDKGTIVHGKTSLEYGTEVPIDLGRGDRLRVRQAIALEISTGDYTFEVGFSTMRPSVYEQRASLAYEELAAEVLPLCMVAVAGHFAVAFRRLSGHAGPVQLLHHGLANLPGDQQMVRVKT